jgi:hypothetical protein
LKVRDTDEVRLYLVLVARDGRVGRRRARTIGCDRRERETSFIVFIRTYTVSLHQKI